MLEAELGLVGVFLKAPARRPLKRSAWVKRLRPSASGSMRKLCSPSNRSA